MKLYTISGAPRGWRVLIGLALKGLPYEVHYLLGSAQEHKQPAFLRVNPRGTIPVLESGDIIVRDSIAILAWLDQAFPEKPLFGNNSYEASAIWEITMDCCDYLRKATDTLLRPILVNNIEPPAKDSETMTALLAASDAMHAECARLEHMLERQLYLAGHQPTAAEAVSFPEVRLIQRAIDKKPDIMGALGFSDFDTKYPNLSGWRERVTALPNMGQTMPHHWKEG